MKVKLPGGMVAIYRPQTFVNLNGNLRSVRAFVIDSIGGAYVGGIYYITIQMGIGWPSALFEYVYQCADFDAYQAANLALTRIQPWPGTQLTHGEFFNSIFKHNFPLVDKVVA